MASEPVDMSQTSDQDSLDSQPSAPPGRRFIQCYLKWEVLARKWLDDKSNDWLRRLEFGDMSDFERSEWRSAREEEWLAWDDAQWELFEEFYPVRDEALLDAALLGRVPVNGETTAELRDELIEMILVLQELE